MKQLLEELANLQLENGQFPTTMVNTVLDKRMNVHTICPTYLVGLILQFWRERAAYSFPVLDDIIKKGAGFLKQMAYKDSVSGLIVWHFNAFYQPDSEETAAAASILYTEGLLSKRELLPLRDHFLRTEGQRGVGVWLVDDYSLGNTDRKPVYDPVVSMMVLFFFKQLFDEEPERTRKFVDDSITKGTESHYYPQKFRLTIASMLGYGERPGGYLARNTTVFHHQSRPEVTYQSPAVPMVAKLLSTV